MEEKAKALEAGLPITAINLTKFLAMPDILPDSSRDKAANSTAERSTAKKAAAGLRRSTSSVEEPEGEDRGHGASMLQSDDPRVAGVMHALATTRGGSNGGSANVRVLTWKLTLA